MVFDLFNVFLLGGKVPAFNLLVEINAIIARPLPSYAAGVDLNTKDVYHVSCFDTNSKYGGSIQTNNKLVGSPNKQANLLMLNHLKNDIIKYWQRLNIDNYKPYFDSAL